MPASFSTLPTELMDEILCHCSRDDLAKIRCLSRRFRMFAEPLLFQKVTFWHSSRSADNVASIIDTDHLRTRVQEFRFSAQKSPETLDLDDFLDSSNPLPEQALRTLRLVSQLENLTVLRCHHDVGPSAYHDDETPVHNVDLLLVDKFDTFRGELLANLIVGLAERELTAKPLDTLDIVNLPCRPQQDLTGDPGFFALLGTLRTLSIKFDYNYAHNKPQERSPRGHVSRQFFIDFPDTWLAPAPTDLTYLSLGADELWGYILKVDFRGVHFPQLQSLVMEKFVFGQDWQLEWILSHTSLQELSLLKCQILIQAVWLGEMDEDGYPLSMTDDETALVQTHFFYRSWHNYYQKILDELENLRSFTTWPDRTWVEPDWYGQYGVFSEWKWSKFEIDPHRSELDEWMLKQVMAKANERMREHLEATTKRRSGN